MSEPGRHGARRAMADNRAKRLLARRPPWKFARLRGDAGADQAEGHGRFPRRVAAKERVLAAGPRALRRSVRACGTRVARQSRPSPGGGSNIRSLETAENVCHVFETALEKVHGKILEPGVEPPGVDAPRAPVRAAGRAAPEPASNLAAGAENATAAPSAPQALVSRPEEQEP